MEKRVCVIGAGGFVASWLVKLLLSKGFIVHGTVRDPSDLKKNAHLTKLEKSAENLKLFKADLLDYSGLAAAVAGCEAVFHVASPLPPHSVSNPMVEIIEPAVTGTLNVLKACSEAKVKKVIVVSSLSAVAVNPNKPPGMIMDENCWSDEEFCRMTNNWYFLSKTMAEKEALRYAEKHGLNLITVCPGYIFGPYLQKEANASSLLLIDILKGVPDTVPSRMLPIVDVRDAVDALFILYEKPEASGRYLCTAYSMKMKDLVELLKSLYPNYTYPKHFEGGEEVESFTTEKLEKLGWKFMTLKKSLIDSVECYQAAGAFN